MSQYRGVGKFEKPEDHKKDNGATLIHTGDCLISIFGLYGERETICCFLDFQETGEMPREMKKLVNDLLVIGQLAQLEP